MDLLCSHWFVETDWVKLLFREKWETSDTGEVSLGLQVFHILFGGVCLKGHEGSVVCTQPHKKSTTMVLQMQHAHLRECVLADKGNVHIICVVCLIVFATATGRPCFGTGSFFFFLGADFFFFLSLVSCAYALLLSVFFARTCCRPCLVRVLPEHSVCLVLLYCISTVSDRSTCHSLPLALLTPRTTCLRTRCVNMRGCDRTFCPWTSATARLGATWTLSGICNIRSEAGLVCVPAAAGLESVGGLITVAANTGTLFRRDPTICTKRNYPTDTYI